MKRTFLINILLALVIFSYSQEWKWSNQLKCNNEVFPSANVAIDLATDNTNSVYYCGHYNANALTIANHTIPNSGDWDGFLCKFNSAGTIQWLKQIAGALRDEASAIAVVDNYVYVIGSYRSNPITFAPGITLPGNAGVYSVYMAKYDLNGNCKKATRLFYGTGAGSINRAKEFTYDPQLKRFVIIGQFQLNTNYFNGSTTVNVAAISSKDMFVAQFDTSGAVSNFKNYRTTNNNTIFKDISLTTDEGYYISGDLTGDIYFSANDTLRAETVNTDIMAIKLDKSLTKLWARKAGGNGIDYGNSSVSDEYGSLYLTGMVTGTVRFDSTATLKSNPITVDGNGNMYLAKYNKQGSLLWVRTKGNTGRDDGYGLTYHDNLIEFCGNYAGTVTFNQDVLTSSSLTDYNTSFAIFDIDGVEVGAKSIGGTLEEAGRAITFDQAGRTIIAGYFLSSPLSIGDSTYTNPGLRDGFIACYSYPFKATFSTIETIKCYGDSTGRLIVTPYFGTGPYNYVWSGNVSYHNDSLAYNLKAGSYSVTVTDALGSVTTANYTFTQPSAINIAASSTNVSCNPLNGISNDGKITITTTGGTGSHNYLWSTISGSGANPVAKDQTTLTKGLYRLTVTDDNACTAVDSFTIGEPAPIIFKGSMVTDASGGASNGAVNLTATGGNHPPAYSTFTWSNGATTEDITTLPGGNYSIVVTDTEGCKGDTIFHVNDLSIFQVAVTSITDVDCFGNSTGSATVSPLNGSGNYSYDWRNSFNLPVGINSPTLSGVVAGTYYANVIDIGIDTAIAIVVITQPTSALSTVISGVDVLCYGTSTGVINLGVSGGTIPYRYSWRNGSSVEISTVEDLVNIPADDYTVTVTDTNGCTTNNNISIDESTPLDINITIDHPIFCYGDQNGRLTATATGGTGQKSYQWNDPGSQTDQTATALFGGTYTVTATDLNGCTIEDVITLFEPDSISLSTLILSPMCYGNSNGSIVLTVDGGTPTFDYVWSNGTLSKNISDLVAGEYSVTVTDANACVKQDTFMLTQPLEIDYTSILLTDASCFGISDGTIEITATGGTGTLEYSIDGGASYATNNVFSSVSGGSHTVIVRDDNNCESVDSLVTVSQPQEVLISSVIYTVPTCFGFSDGSIELSASGGAGGSFQFSIDNGNSYSTDPVFSGVSATNYTLKVLDADNCPSSDSTITVDSPDPVTLQDIQIVGPTCYGGTNGSIAITAAGGTGTSYQYSTDGGTNYSSNATFSGLSATEFTIKVIDGNDCESADSSVSIVDPLDITIVSETATNALCNGLPNGTISITVSGTASDFDYSVDNGTTFISNSGEFESLLAGTYHVVVRNQNNCEKTGSQLIILDPEPVTVDTVSVDPAVDNTNGAMVVLAQGGTSPYNYVLSTGGSDSVTNASGEFQELQADSYIIYALDDNLCKSDTIHVRILGISTELVVFDAFSPNGDGVNETWNIINISKYLNCTVTIFNSWGNQVFSSSGYSEAWDGSYNGKMLPAGTYYYIIDLGDGSDVLSGPVSIVR